MCYVVANFEDAHLEPVSQLAGTIWKASCGPNRLAKFLEHFN
jgi:hypothetical protein